MSRKSAYDVATHIRRSIEGGEYRQHERLPPSRELASQLGVARNTLREALYRLEKEGLLETRRGSGTVVATSTNFQPPKEMTRSTPLELIDARLALEPHICRLCVLHGRHDDLEKLESLCEQMEAAVHNPLVFSEADTMYHAALAGATRNTLLVWLIGQINSVRSFDEWSKMRQVTLDEPMIRLYNTQHREILSAIRARESELAANRMKEHLQSARLSLMRAAEA